MIIIKKIQKITTSILSIHTHLSFFRWTAVTACYAALRLLKHFLLFLLFSGQVQFRLPIHTQKMHPVLLGALSSSCTTEWTQNSQRNTYVLDQTLKKGKACEEGALR